MNTSKPKRDAIDACKQTDDTGQRIAEWVRSCRGVQANGLTPAQRFEQAMRDMAHAGFRLPHGVVAGVRAQLNKTPREGDL